MASLLAGLVILAATHGLDILPAPVVPQKRFHSDGDLSIAVLQSVTLASTAACDGPFIASSVELQQIIARAFDDFNGNGSGLLPTGFRLGYTMMDYCFEDSFAVAQALNFLPSVNGTRYIALVCCGNSQQTILVSSLSSAFRIPQMSFYAASDTLSDKTAYKFFLRTLTPDKNQVRAMVELMVRLNWTYVQFLYAEGDYGDNAMKKFEELSRLAGICVAYSKRLSRTMPPEDYVALVKTMRTKSKAHVVISCLYTAQMISLAAELQQQNVTSMFQFVGSTTWASGLGYVDPLNRAIATGSLSFEFLKRQQPAMVDLLRPVTLSSETRNPWLSQYFEERFKCNESTCSADTNLASAVSTASSYYPLVYDTADALTRGLGLYLPRLQGQWSRFNTSEYLDELRRLDFEGKNGRVRFDENGDNYGGYAILNHWVDDAGRVSTREVGTWDVLSSTLQLDESSIRWSNGSTGSPESVCSRPCAFGEIQIEREVACCWQCFRCRENEITDAAQTQCLPCPKYCWPNAETLRSCIELDAVYVTTSDALGTALIAASIVGSVLTLTTASLYIKNNGEQLIRASCREASYIMLAGIQLNFACLLAFVGKPSALSCYVQRFSFHLLSTFIYAATLIKVVKIFRIFVVSARTIRAPKWLHIRAQVFTIALIIAVEAVVITCSTFITKPGDVRVMPSPSEPYVELTCNESVASVMTALSPNLALVAACSVLAFLSRKIPQYYNESAQIAFSVYTSLILWMAFIPAFLTTTRAHHHTLLITLSMIVISLVSLCCQFIPKLYALYVLPNRQVALVVGIKAVGDRAGEAANANLPPTGQVFTS